MNTDEITIERARKIEGLTWIVFENHAHRCNDCQIVNSDFEGHDEWDTSDCEEGTRLYHTRNKWYRKGHKRNIIYEYNKEHGWE